jgi:6-phosphogluconolactonase
VSAIELRVVESPADVARDGADLLASLVRGAVADHGTCALAVSGGTTPRAAFERLANDDLPWEAVTFFQVDERMAPDGDEERNLTHLRRAFAQVPARIDPMPVTDPDPEAAAAAYAARLPARFDVIHLGIGPDGHTASLVPGDPVLEVTDRLVAITDAYQGRRRMTFTYPALARTDRVVWLIAGADKREAVRQLLAHDPAVPAGRVDGAPAVVLCDAPAS